MYISRGWTPSSPKGAGAGGGRTGQRTGYNSPCPLTQMVAYMAFTTRIYLLEVYHGVSNNATDCSDLGSPRVMLSVAVQQRDQTILGVSIPSWAVVSLVDPIPFSREFS